MIGTQDALIALLRSQGADRVDPVRFRYIEALATRTLLHEGEARRLLDDKLAQALVNYRDRLSQPPAIISGAEMPDRRTPLADLVRDLVQPAPADAEGKQDDSIGARPELGAINRFRSTWSQLSVNRQVKQAIRQGPENAGRSIHTCWYCVRWR